MNNTGKGQFTKINRPPKPQNPNCDGSWCTKSTGEVKLYPTGTGELHGNMILCRSCFRHENNHRAEMRNDPKYNPENFPHYSWDAAKVYKTEE
jgi:hypothetical protein